MDAPPLSIVCAGRPATDRDDDDDDDGDDGVCRHRHHHLLPIGIYTNPMGII